MSGEKVVRYMPVVIRKRLGAAEYSVAEMHPHDNGRYIEYADVAGLVEAMKAVIRVTDRNTDVFNNAKAALARFQP